MCIVALLQRLSDAMISSHRVFVTSQKEYVQALHDARTYVPSSGTDFDWVYEHAVWEYEQTQSAIEVLEKKSETLITLASSITGAEGIVVIVGLLGKGIPWQVALSFLPTFGLGLLAITLCLLCRNPAEQALPAHALAALRYAEHYDNLAKARFALQYHVASVAAGLTAKAKGRLLTTASLLLVSALFLLLVPAALAIAF